MMGIHVNMLSKIKVPRDVRSSKSRNITSLDENGLKFRKNTIQKMGQDQVTGRVSVLCWLAAPIAMFYGNLLNFEIRSKSVLRYSLVIMFLFISVERNYSAY